MSKINIKRTKLDNGLELAAIHLPSFHSITNFLTIRSGSRYEDSTNNGIAHFLEHMVFKGTEKFADTKILAEAIEGVGGYFNAWTNVDHTAYWNTVPSKEWRLGAELPFELAFRSLLRDEDLERERGVIIEEIRMIQDDPARYVDDLSGELVFAGNPLSQQIIGTEETIRKMTIDQFRDYKTTFYHPSQALFIVIGDVEGKDYQSLVEELSNNLDKKEPSQPKRISQPSRKALKVLNKPTDQTHFMLSMAEPTFAYTNADRFKAVVLNAVLGRGMSSRLFLNVREKRGLAYSVRSSYAGIEDTGVISIYGGVNTTKVAESLEAIRDELKRLQDEPVGAEELRKAQRYLQGAFALKSDDPISLAQWYGTDHLLGMKETFEEASELVGQVTSSQIQELAQEIFKPEYLTLAVIGPYGDDQKFRDFLGL